MNSRTHARPLTLKHAPAGKVTSLENKIEVLRQPESKHALNLIKSFFHYDPAKRISALEAIKHPYFTEAADFNPNCVWRQHDSSAGLDIRYYPERPLQSVGMHGQSMGRGGANAHSSAQQQQNVSSHKRANNNSGLDMPHQYGGSNKQQRR